MGKPQIERQPEVTRRKSTLVWSSEYWDISKVDGYNKSFNFILSGRGSGKTVRLKKKVFDNWVKKKETFAWVLRSDSELDHAFYTTFFTHFEDIEPDFYFKGNLLLEKGTNEVVGIFATMTNINRRIRKIHLVTCSTIVFDEFILNPYAQYQKYKKSEVDDFMNAYETLARNYDYKTKVYWLGNPIVIANPYFLQFKVDPGVVRASKGKIAIFHDIIAVDYFDVPEIVLEKKNATDYAKLAQIMGGGFHEQVFESQEQYEPKISISKTIPEGYRLQSQIKQSGMTLYFYTNGTHFYVSDKIATLAKDPTYHTFDVTQWDGKDITLIDSTDPVKSTMEMTLRSIRRNQYMASSDNVHYVVTELITLLR